MWAIVGTWRMALEGITKAAGELSAGRSAGDALEIAVKETEDYPYFKSVGYGGLPNENMEVELDAGYMDGDDLTVGAVAGIKDFANPISVARRLSLEKCNNFLVGTGAEAYASKSGFERKTMLTQRAKIHYYNRLKQEQKESKAANLKPYIGHDTVGMACLDQAQKICVATSTSGLFMKRPGRVGDSPLVGSGFYADSTIGAATATGLGEDIMKGLISYEIVRCMEEGMSVQAACEMAVNKLDLRLKKINSTAGDISVVALDKKGNFGVASNISGFSFVYASEKTAPTVYVTELKEGHTLYTPAKQEWLDEYIKTRTAPLKLL